MQVSGSEKVLKPGGMVNKKWWEILACPKCKGQLEFNSKRQRFICQKCRLKYKIKDDIPILLIDEAEGF
jgi:uncharacterized protein